MRYPVWPKKTWLLPNAVDSSFFDINARPEPGGTPVGLFIGTVCYRKNQNHFIRALDDLAGRSKFKIIFLGQTDNSPYCDEFLRLVKDRPWCEHVGFAGRNLVKQYFQTASFLALPTLEDNCPMVILEAMASGVPVLASNVGGIPDLIRPDVTGLFCDPAKPESISAGIKHLLENPKSALDLAAAAKKEAALRFHPDVVARGHLEIYREVLQSA